MRQLLTESVLLAVAGGVAGLLFAWLSFSFLKQIIPDSMALNAGVRIDARIFSFTLLLSLLIGVIFGLAPALQASKVDLNEALKQSGGRTGTGAGHRRLRGALVVVEIALALVLLAGAGLLIRTFLRLRALDIGVNPENVLTLRTTLPRNKYGELPKRAAFYQQVLERVRVLPGVVTPEYFKMLGVVPALGRDFRAEENRPDTRFVVIISHGLWQRRFNADPNVVGKPTVLSGQTFNVIGVMPRDFEDLLAANFYQKAEVGGAGL